MWILEPTKDLYQKESGIDKLNFLFKQDKFYIMDNHLATGWCWLQELNPDESYNLFHIDQHMDLWNETPKEAYQHIQSINPLSIHDFTNLEYRDATSNLPIKVFNYANYILLLNNLYPNWFKKCFFACNAYCQNKNDFNIYYNPYGYELPTHIANWIDETDRAEEEKDTNQWLINLDIDYFFADNKFQLYTDESIRVLCDNILKCMDKIKLVTIALSPECCGGWEKAIRITNIIAEKFKLNFDLEKEIYCLEEVEHL